MSSSSSQHSSPVASPPPSSSLQCLPYIVNGATPTTLYYPDADGLLHALQAHVDFRFEVDEMSTIVHAYDDNNESGGGSADDDMGGIWMIHKQNKIQLTSRIVGPITSLTSSSISSSLSSSSPCPLYVGVPSGLPAELASDTFYPLQSLHLMIHAISEMPHSSSSSKPPNPNTRILIQEPSIHTTSTSPDIIQIYPNTIPPTLSSSSSSSSVPLDAISRVEWKKLKFSSATSGNGKSREHQEYFHLVISLVGTIDSSLHILPQGTPSTLMIASVVTPRIKVIGQNPARFKRARKATISSAGGGAPASSSSSSPSTSSPSSSSSSSVAPTPIIHPSASPPSLLGEQPYHPSLFLEHDNSSSDLSASSSPHHHHVVGYNIHSPGGSGGGVVGAPPSWTPAGDETNSIYRYGNVGININAPPEALSVGGNILVGGNIMKPSDKRIKRNIVPITKGQQLTNIKNLRVYDYERVDLSRPATNNNNGENNNNNVYVPERGFIAQEVQRVVPGAVRVVGNVQLPDGTTVDDLLVVDDRVLLLETIGATQELEHMLNNVSEETASNRRLLDYVYTLLDTVTLSEHRVQSRDAISSPSRPPAWWHKVNMFSMGPAWSFLLLGFFFPPFWFLGACFIFSKIWIRQVSGLVSLCLVCVFYPSVASTIIACPERIRLYVAFFWVFLFIFFGLVTSVVIVVASYVRAKKRKAKLISTALSNSSRTPSGTSSPSSSPPSSPSLFSSSSSKDNSTSTSISTSGVTPDEDNNTITPSSSSPAEIETPPPRTNNNSNSNNDDEKTPSLIPDPKNVSPSPSP
eukprot:TRINITY_DN8602_c0_g1_i1.p1 TRINITY_DN8602_c0_g1~~TRINITY_DN8602_c0_g1_i1.p1  ORF type:complete len:804 (-),score=260.45 TRINITY_DN8602_c0_g1_i1:8-2419(-)